MKIFTCVVMAVLVGVGLGYASNVGDFGVSPPDPDLSGGLKFSHVRSDRPERADLAVGLGPRVVVDESEFKFGQMFHDQTGSHTFIIRNAGAADLNIKATKTSCKCTVSEVSRETIPPNETAKITLEWKTGKRTGKYRKFARVTTNDSRQPEVQLWIDGVISPESLFEPPHHFATAVSKNETADFESKLYFYTARDVQLLSHAFNIPEFSKSFQVEYEPIPKDQVDKEHALCAYTVRVKVLEGMPVGNFRQTITFETEPAMTTPVRLGINGQISDDVMVVGPRFNPNTSTLEFGPVKHGAERKMALALQTMGDLREKVQFDVKETVPADLEIAFFPRQTMRDKQTSKIIMSIAVPKTAEVGNYAGDSHDTMGRVVLTTSHPEFPELVIYVKLTVDP